MLLPSRHQASCVVRVVIVRMMMMMMMICCVSSHCAMPHSWVLNKLKKIFFPSAEYMFYRGFCWITLRVSVDFY